MASVRSAEELGIYNCYAERFQDLELVSPSALEAPLAVVPVHSRRIEKDLWIAISMDRVRLFSQCLLADVPQTGYEYNDEDTSELL